MGKWFKSGAPWIWMTGGAVSLSLVAVLGLLLLIGWRGLVYFWPHTIYQWEIDRRKWSNKSSTGRRVATIANWCRLARLRADWSEAGRRRARSFWTRYLVKTGNREFVAAGLPLGPGDQYQVLAVASRQRIGQCWSVTTNGNFYGYIEQVLESGKAVDGDLHLSNLHPAVSNGCWHEPMPSTIRSARSTACRYWQPSTTSWKNCVSRSVSLELDDMP